MLLLEDLSLISKSIKKKGNKKLNKLKNIHKNNLLNLSTCPIFSLFLFFYFFLTIYFKFPRTKHSLMSHSFLSVYIKTMYI